MRVQFSFVGEARLLRDAYDHGDLWVALDAVPREGETVEVPDIPSYYTVVRTVVWHPVGDEDAPEPFVYVVLGEAHR